ncbi:Gfo/Idh/MocA family oxidoreductase [bacterium]|nr:Gfo/Idh/MocA family oxidoreductase [bacterium]
MDKVTWLLIGAGDIASRRVGPALVKTENSELVAVCDLSPERAAAVAAQLGVATVYTDPAVALAECAAEAVYIATPQTTHIELSLAVLAAGKHLLCEKPLGLNGAECLRLLAAARRSDRVTSCSNYRRLSEQVKLTEALLARGEIGELTGGWAIYSTPFYNPAKAHVCQASGLSRIKELGYYLIDIAHNFLGMPSEVVAQGSILHPEVMNDVEEIATVVLKFPGGAMFTILFNCTSPGTRHEFELFGTQGRIYWPAWPPHGNGPVVKLAGAGTQEFPAHTDENWHLPMIEDYVQALLTGRPPVCVLESAVKTEVITDAVFRSLASGRVEPVLWEEPS